jgi:vacuolar-type H+-ATPase subunit I/STV1
MHPVDFRTDYGPLEDRPQARYTFQVQLMPGETMGFETVVDRDTSRAALVELTDRLAWPVERQKLKVEIRDHERQVVILQQKQKEQVEARTRRVADFQAQYQGTARAQSGRSFEASAKQRADLNQIDQALEEIKSNIAVWSELIARKRALIDGVEFQQAAE